jgi:2-hydroxy-6-oxonona-2,4-dienedioate hydrolase
MAAHRSGYKCPMHPDVPAAFTPFLPPAPEITALQTRARRCETPSSIGPVVWHTWSPAVPVSGLPPLVLLHGGSGSWTHWVRNIDALLASGRTLYLPDLPGFGDSASPDGRDADALPAPLMEGLEALLGDAPCDMAGFSFGGMVGGFIAGKMPARVLRLVLVGAPGMGVRARQPVLTSWRHLKDEAAWVAAHRANLAALMLSRPDAIDSLALNLHMANVVRDRLPGRSMARTDILKRTLPGIRCPVFAIYGGEDVLYEGEFAALETALRQAPQFRRLDVIPNAGHWVQYQQAAAFNAALLAALDAPPA